jgi:hypothetical protein
MNQDELGLETDILKDFLWTVEHEEILVDFADKAMCYRWLHTRSHLYYYKLNAWFTIPSIIADTLTGTANFAFQAYNPYVQSMSSNVIGAINILTAILSTISQFLKISELNESHRISSIYWDKYYRNIKVELSKHPEERINPSHMLKIAKEDFDRLMETSPMIKNNIINQFKKTFKHNRDPIKKAAFILLKKPEICDELISTENVRHNWFKEYNAYQYETNDEEYKLSNIYNNNNNENFNGYNESLNQHNESFNRHNESFNRKNNMSNNSIQNNSDNIRGYNNGSFNNGSIDNGSINSDVLSKYNINKNDNGSINSDVLSKYNINKNDNGSINSDVLSKYNSNININNNENKLNNNKSNFNNNDKNEILKKRIAEDGENLINVFKIAFYKINEREATTYEIIDNLKDQISEPLLEQLLINMENKV